MKVEAFYKTNDEKVALRMIYINEDGTIFAVEDKDGQLESLKTVTISIEIE